MEIINRIIKNKCLTYILGIFIIFIAIGSYCYVQGSNYIFSEKEDRIYNTLRATGYSRAGACGIMGNMAVENPAFEADLYGNGGITYGLFQWNNVGERKDNLVRWCNNRGLYHNRVDGQLAFAIHELGGGDPIAKRLDKFLTLVENPREAAMEFTVGFERCVGSTGNSAIDAKYEGSIYPEYYGKTYQAMAKRIACAEEYYNGYTEDYRNRSLVYKLEKTPTPGLVSEVEEELQIEIQRSLDFHVDTSTPEGKSKAPLRRLMCVAIGYFCGCVYLSLLFIDRNSVNVHNLKKVRQIPHARSVMAHFGIKKASYVLLSDVFKLLFAIAMTSLFVKGLGLNEIILYTGLGVIIGNACPFWNKFSGGLGLTVTVLTLILYMPIWGLLCCFIGLYIATILQSLTVGVLVMSMSMIPFAYHYKSPAAAGIITIILVMLILSHQRFLLKYFDKNVVHNHYMERRKRLT